MIVALVVAGGWWLVRAEAISVHTTPAVAATAAEQHTVLNASGYVTARREATVSSKVTGKVNEVFVEEGMKVSAEQVLARLDATNVTASLELAKAQALAARAALAETRVRLTEAEQELNRQSALLHGSVATQADFDHAQAAAHGLRARLDQQATEATVVDRTVAVWQQQLDDTVIRAPFAGTVTSKNAQPGEMISPMSTGGFTRTGICTLVDMQSLEIEIDVNESYINRVESGQAVEATLDAYPDWKMPCRVIAIIPTADRNKSTVRVRVGFDRLDDRILPDMSVKVGFRDRGDNATAVRPDVAVPKSALAQADGHDVVFVVHGNRAERRAVAVRQTQADRTMLAGGVAPGERVIIDPPPGMTDGILIKEILP